MRNIALPIALLATVLVASNAGAATWTDCTPANVATFANRVHVKCTASVAGIQYFAVATSDSAAAARFISLANSALVAGRTLSVFYDPADTSGAAWGCQSNDCRSALGLAIK